MEILSIPVIYELKSYIYQINHICIEIVNIPKLVFKICFFSYPNVGLVSRWEVLQGDLMERGAHLQHNYQTWQQYDNDLKNLNAWLDQAETTLTSQASAGINGDLEGMIRLFRVSSDLFTLKGPFHTSLYTLHVHIWSCVSLGQEVLLYTWKSF